MIKEPAKLTLHKSQNIKTRSILVSSEGKQGGERERRGRGGGERRTFLRVLKGMLVMPKPFKSKMTTDCAPGSGLATFQRYSCGVHNNTKKKKKPPTKINE
jgi:hypothetical protein